ncbi:MAG: AMP-binding protein [Proteobacteria bacterium]|nr:AMP-binding protein [Pseudomonadota bacterium]
MTDWDAIHRGFRWAVPQYFNIAYAVCDRHENDRVALIYEGDSGIIENWTFRQFKDRSNQLANWLSQIGLKQGDRVGIVLTQRPETPVCHLAAFKMGAISIPLANLFGKEALKYRLQDSGAKIVFTEDENLEVMLEIKEELESLQHVVLVGKGKEKRIPNFDEVLIGVSKNYRVFNSLAEQPALIIYTSGTTGNPKGALLAHRSLIGHLTGFEMSHNFFPQSGDLSWTPADWAWIGGLMNILFCTWYYGSRVFAFRAKKFSPEQTLRQMANHKIKNTFLPPTVLKLFRQVPGIQDFGVQLRSLMSAGEALGADTLVWAEEAFGIKVNEMFGQTEVNYIVGNCQAVMPCRPGSMGKAYPGHIVEIVDPQGKIVKAGESGEIAFLRDNDPVFFLNYWNNPKATRDKFCDSWALSGDLGVKDDEGYIWFKGRKDDVINSAGYRIGPAEIEEQLIKHPAVALAAVVPSPDEIRGSVVKAFISLADGVEESTELKKEIQQFVKKNLSAHEYPREIEVIKEFPMTTTKKIKRRDLRLREEKRKRLSQ